MCSNTYDCTYLYVGVFYTRYASEIESDPVGEYTRATMVLEELGINPDDVTVDDFRQVPTFYYVILVILFTNTSMYFPTAR